MSLRSLLVPLAVILLSFGQLIVNGWNKTSTLAENLPNPLNTTGFRIVDLVRQSPHPGRVFELIFDQPAVGPSQLRTDARLHLQLSSAGKTRLLVIRPYASDPSRRAALMDLIRGRGRLQIVADRKWVDLGSLPSEGRPLKVQVFGLLPAPFGFAELNKPADPLFQSIEALARDTPGAAARRIFPRYRLRVPDPVSGPETLGRFFFFFSVSPVLAVAGVLALSLLLAGWWLLGKEKTATAVCCLIPSAVLLHAVCLPPLQGADETSHGATIERIVFPAPDLKWLDYPESISRAAAVLQQDRVQFHPEEPLPLTSADERSLIRKEYEGNLAAEAVRPAPAPVAAYVQEIDARAPLFFRPWALAASFLQPRSLVDRLSLYRLISALSGLALFCAGAVLLHRGAVGPGAVLAYGLVWLVPYVVISVASITNYAPAIGLGSLLAASVVTLVVSDELRPRVAAAAILVSGSWAGIPIWPDFVFLAPIATVGVFLWAVIRSTARQGKIVRRLSISLTLLALAAGLSLLAARLPGVKSGNIGTRMPLDFPSFHDPLMGTVLAIVAAPFLAAAAGALVLAGLGSVAEAKRRRWSRRITFALGSALILSFLMTPYSTVRYENARLPYADFVLAHIHAFTSSAFGWDQDTLSWKLYVGAGGWHDVFFPDWFYAAARWAFVALAVVLPSWFLFATDPPQERKAVLLVVAGFGASLCVATLSLRYFQPGNPWGRFMLPWLPLVLSPLLIPVTLRQTSGVPTLAFRAGVLIQIWTAVSILGTRYLFGQG